MNKPKMILFDYGQTLSDEKNFDGVRGTKAVLNSCVENPENIRAEEIQAFADELNKDIGRFDSKTSHLCKLEFIIINFKIICMSILILTLLFLRNNLKRSFGMPHHLELLL